MKSNPLPSIFLTCAALVLLLQKAPAADITGKVTLKGTPPPEKLIDMKRDPNCGGAQTKPVTTRHYLVGNGNGLANVFVYVKAGAKAAPPPADKPLLDQVNCLYEPFVMGVQTGQKFRIKNSDKTMHNVHATPRIKENKEFNFAQTSQNQINEKVFDKAEVLVRFKCDVHDWMYAYVGVVDHPHFAVTDKDGSFKLPNLPAGKYTIEAYHLKAGAATEEITVADGDKKTVDFTLEVKATPAGS